MDTASSCSCNYQKSVCLEPGVNAYMMEGTSAGKVCLGKAPFNWQVVVPTGNDGASKPASGDPAALFMQTYNPSRVKLLFIRSIRNAAGAIIPRTSYDTLGLTIQGMWFKGDNWMPQLPEDTDQSLVTGIGIESLDCETYVRCWGNPLPTSCFPTFSNTQDKAIFTFGFTDPGAIGPITIDGQIVVWQGVTPLSVGKCYLENPVPGINPTAGRPVG